MKLTRYTLVLILALTFSLPAFSQEAKQPDSPFAEKIKTFRNHKRFGMQYDKFKDQTLVFAGPYNMTGTMEYVATNTMIFLSSAFRFDGQKLGKPVDAFYLIFDYSGREWQFLKNAEVYLLVDGERFVLGEAEHDSDIHLGGVSESIAVKMDSATFEKMGKGKVVEIKVGPRPFKFKDEHLQSFRDLYSLSQSSK